MKKSDIPPFTSLSTLGEFGLINRLSKNITTSQPSTQYGIGDDAAVIGYEGDKRILTSTDMLIEGVHFDISYTALRHLGYKSVVVALSDLYAMNATPTQILISIAMTNKYSMEMIDELYEGIQAATEAYEVDLVGGDTTASSTGLVISVTVIGEANENEIVYRHGASKHDIIIVTGDVGASYMGLQVLQREKKIFKTDPNHRADLEPYQYLLQRHLRPEARRDIPPLLKSLGVRPTSMIDVSDGLSSDLLHLCKSSKLGCKLFEEKIPIDNSVLTTCEEMGGLHIAIPALNGGEDYELLFTIHTDDYKKVQGDPNFTPIGHMSDLEFGTKLIGRGGQEIELTAQGWNALKPQNESE